MAVGTCILLANGKCLPPPPIFDLPPPPDPTLIWHLIAEDGSTSEAIERILSQRCEWDSLLTFIGLNQLGRSDDLVYYVLATILGILFIALSTTACILHRRRIRHRIQHGTSLDSSGGHSKLSAETVTTGNVSTWTQNRQRGKMVPVVVTANGPETVVSSADMFNNRCLHSQSSASISHGTAASGLFKRSNNFISSPRSCHLQRIMTPSFTNIESRRRAVNVHSSTIGPRFIRHNSQLYRHADYPRPYGNGAFTHCSPIVNADGRFCIPITCHGNGSCHYEEFPYDDCDSAIVHPYKFRHLIQQANGHLTFAQQNESLEDQMAVGNIVDHSVVDRRRLSMSIDRHVRRPPPDTKPPPPPAPADMCIQNQLIKTSGSAELPFTEFVRTSTIYSNNSSNMSIEKIV